MKEFDYKNKRDLDNRNDFIRNLYHMLSISNSHTHGGRGECGEEICPPVFINDCNYSLCLLIVKLEIGLLEACKMHVAQYFEFVRLPIRHATFWSIPL